jgi:hypothetical protein
MQPAPQATVNLTPLFLTAALALLVALVIQSVVVPWVQSRTRRRERWEDDLSELSGLLQEKLDRSLNRYMKRISTVRMWERIKDMPETDTELVEQRLLEARTAREEASETVEADLARVTLLVDRLRREHRKATYWGYLLLLRRDLWLKIVLLDSAIYARDDESAKQLKEDADEARRKLVVYLEPRIESMKPPPRKMARSAWRKIKAERWDFGGP